MENLRPIEYDKLKVGDEVVTRDGRKGRVICTDREHGSPIVTLIGKDAFIYCYNPDGSMFKGQKMDEDIFLPPKKEYVNLFRNDCGGYAAGAGFKNKELAAQCVDISGCLEGYTYIKTIEVEL